MMKTIFSTLLAAVFLLSALTGCNGKNMTGENRTTPTPNATASAAVPTKGIDDMDDDRHDGTADGVIEEGRDAVDGVVGAGENALDDVVDAGEHVVDDVVGAGEDIVDDVIGDRDSETDANKTNSIRPEPTPYATANNE